MPAGPAWPRGGNVDRVEDIPDVGDATVGDRRDLGLGRGHFIEPDDRGPAAAPRLQVGEERHFVWDFRKALAELPPRPRLPVGHLVGHLDDGDAPGVPLSLVESGLQHAVDGHLDPGVGFLLAGKADRVASVVSPGHSPHSREENAKNDWSPS